MAQNTDMIPDTNMIPDTDGIYRCMWCRDGGIMQEYHDREWGIPLHDDRKQFEFLMMEVMQCGLNWNMMLKKRETFRACFDNFDYDAIADYGEAEIFQILETPNMIRSRRKIEAVINNARQFRKIREEFGSFDAYLWRFSDNKTIRYRSRDKGGPAARNKLSDQISSDLKKRGFKYLGSITLYSHLQACGIINDHERGCFLYKKIMDAHPHICKLTDD